MNWPSPGGIGTILRSIPGIFEQDFVLEALSVESCNITITGTWLWGHLLVGFRHGSYICLALSWLTVSWYKEAAHKFFFVRLARKMEPGSLQYTLPLSQVSLLWLLRDFKTMCFMSLQEIPGLEWIGFPKLLCPHFQEALFGISVS